MSTPLSAYEIERLKNIERNQAVLAQLGLEALAPPKPTVVRKPKVQRPPTEPSRKSGRIAALPAPSVFIDAEHSNGKVVLGGVDAKAAAKAAAEKRRRRLRRPRLRWTRTRPRHRRRSSSQTRRSCTASCATRRTGSPARTIAPPTTSRRTVLSWRWCGACLAQSRRCSAAGVGARQRRDLTARASSRRWSRTPRLFGRPGAGGRRTGRRLRGRRRLQGRLQGPRARRRCSRLRTTSPRRATTCGRRSSRPTRRCSRGSAPAQRSSDTTTLASSATPALSASWRASLPLAL